MNAPLVASQTLRTPEHTPSRRTGQRRLADAGLAFPFAFPFALALPFTLALPFALAFPFAFSFTFPFTLAFAAVVGRTARAGHREGGDDDGERDDGATHGRVHS